MDTEQEQGLLCYLNNSSLNKSNNNDENDSFNWCTEYLNDIVENLRRSESKRRIIQFKSPQISLRTNLVEMIIKCSRVFGLQKTTNHLAVYLLDVFMDTFKIPLSKVKLVAIACILLASKMEENEPNTPSLIQITILFKNQFLKDEIKIMEQKILKFFDFYLLYPTVQTFIEIYVFKVFTLDDYEINCAINHEFLNSSYDCLRSHMQQMVNQFSDCVIKDFRLCNKTPSMVAAACLLAVRRINSIHPIWPERLQILTSYKLSDLEEFADALIHFTLMLMKNNELSTPDLGYLSESSSNTATTEEENLNNIISESDIENETSDILSTFDDDEKFTETDTDTEDESEDSDYPYPAKRPRLSL